LRRKVHAQELAVTATEGTAELLGLLHSLPAGRYRTFLTVTRIRRVGGREKSAELVHQVVTDFAVRGRRRRALLEKR
jgi:hypothetical protein